MQIMMIRSMEEQDLEQVAAIEQTLFSDAWSPESFRESLRQPEAVFLVAEDKNQGILGYCGSYQALDEAEIVNVAVRGDAQNCGCGRRLVEALLQENELRGVKCFILEVRISNLQAQHVYEKVGFQKIGIRRRFYENPEEDAVIMKKENITADVG
jgi:ribosomal-protein-alanine N-acetyltransferase